MQWQLCITCAVTSVNLQCCAGSLTEGSPHWECFNHSGRQDVHHQGAPHIGSPSIGRLLHVWRGFYCTSQARIVTIGSYVKYKDPSGIVSGIMQ